MEGEGRRILTAMLAAMALFVAYQYVINKVFPPRPAPPRVTQEPGATPATSPAPGGTAPASAPATATRPRPPLSIVDGTQRAPVTLGGGPQDALRVELHPRGAALTTLALTSRDAKGRLRFRTQPHEEAPYELLGPVFDGTRDWYSFATHRVWIEEFGKDGYELSNVLWSAEAAGDRVVFTTTLRADDSGADLLRLTKTYALRAGKPVFNLDLAIENLSTSVLTVRLEQDGPLGVQQDNPQYDTRSILVAQRGASAIELGKARQFAELQKATLDPATGFVALVRPDKGPFVWTALASKYFAVFTRPLPLSGDAPDYVAGVKGLVAAPQVLPQPGDPRAQGDLLARLALKPVQLPPGGAMRYPIEVYAGPKDAEHIRDVDPILVDPARVYYQLAQSADSRCMCTFLWLEELMLWLLSKCYALVANYGVAIMFLVVIVRTLLHPLSVFQQKSMFRMQESMAKMQPKMEALKERYANDKVKLNQEMMKLWSEEGVNPAANFISFLPLFIQMPILVALWTALNTDVHLRHAPFDGWWIVDLSAPDALFKFDPPVTVPILGYIPLIGSVFSNVVSLNVLPIIMGLSMWLQQKYMPKPQVAQSPAPAPSKSRSGMTPADQLRQQRMMAYMMAIIFPLMFYKMPSGLNLYWFASTVFGIGESLIIRHQIEEERKRRATQGPPPPRKPGLVARFFKRIAAQAEELQRKADQLAKAEQSRKKDGKKTD